MKTFMKGTIFLTRDVGSRRYELATGNLSDRTNYSYEIKEDKHFVNADYNDIEHMTSYLAEKQRRAREVSVRIEDDVTTKILKSILEQSDVPYKSGGYRLEIIFDVITTEDGKKYGKELHTGEIFPIVLPKDFDVTYTLYLIEDSTYSSQREYGVKSDYTIEHQDLDKIGSLICNVDVADRNEVEEYLKRFDYGFRKDKKKKAFIDTVITLSKKNVFNKEILSKKEETRITQSEITKIMENIEFLLNRLKKINVVLYEELKREYESLINNNKIELDINKLIELESRINLNLMLDSQGINEYLEKLKLEYLSNFVTENKDSTKISLNNLYDINKLFLQTKDKYNEIEQRNILRNLSCLYLLEVKESIETIKEEDLENTYFSDNIKSIVICIEALKDLGFIEPIEIDYTNINIKTILEVIRDIKFKELSKEECLKLIKNINIG